MLHTFSAARDITTAAALRTLFQGITNGIRKAGLVRLNGSAAAQVAGAFAGASDFSALTNGGINTTSAWEIWRFDDTLQAPISATKMPVYIHILYGVGTSVSLPKLTVTVGYALDNDVTPTALAGATATNGGASMSAANGTLYDCFVSGTTSRLLIVLFGNLGAANGATVLSIERLHDVNGNDIPDAVWMQRANSDNSGNSGNNYIVTNPSVGSGFNWNYASAVWPFSNVTAWGTDFHTTLVYPSLGRLYPPSLNLALVNTSDMVAGALHTLNYYGGAKQFYCVQGPPFTNIALVGCTAVFLARYE